MLLSEKNRSGGSRILRQNDGRRKQLIILLSIVLLCMFRENFNQ